MISQIRQEDSCNAFDQSNLANGEINFYAHKKHDTEVYTSNNTNTAVLLKAGNNIEKSRNRIMNDGK